MKNEVFIARLARGAAVSTLAACLMPHSHTKELVPPMAAHEAAFSNEAMMPEQGTQEGTDKAIVLTMGRAPGEWDKPMEREFRKLALEEAKGTLTDEGSKRLQELSRWRDRLLHPQSAEEILLQIRRDRMLARMEEVLNDYVEFEEMASKARSAA